MDFSDLPNSNNFTDVNNQNTTSTVSNDAAMHEKRRKLLLELENIVTNSSIKDKTISEISHTIEHALPDLLNKLTEEYETLYSTQNELNAKVETLINSKSAQSDVFLEALGQDNYSQEKVGLLSPEARNIVKDYVALRGKINSIQEQLDNIKNQIDSAKEYVEDYGLKVKVRPELGDDFEKLLDTIDISMNRMGENVRVSLYREISSALSSGDSDSLPKDLLELINTLVIDRLEDILKPYEEISAKYVAGGLSHSEFTNLLRKNALFSLLREKVIVDIIREYENNNLNSPIIPTKLKLATERMINDAKNWNNIINTDYSNESTIRIIEDDTKEESHPSKSSHLNSNNKGTDSSSFIIEEEDLFDNSI